jgi:hypothetical protein
VATCTVQYSADVARRAGRAYFWRKFRTPFGALYLVSVPLVLSAILFIYYTEGANWFAGAFGLLLFFNLLMQWASYSSFPKALARLAANQTAEVATSADGVRLTIGPNSSLLKWASFKRIWLYEDFIILAVNPPFVMRFTYVPTAGMTQEVRSDFERASRREAIT